MRQVAKSENRAAVIVAVAVVVLVAIRTQFGISFFDDSFYAAVPMRLASGAHLFTDEATIQAIGSLVAVPFTVAWRGLFGLNGIVLALRLFYVALAAALGWAVVRALKPSFGALVSTVAVCSVLLAPAYNTFAVSYNTTAQLASMLSLSLVVAAWRDGSRVAACGAGALTAMAAVFYPPFAVAALPTAVVAIVLLRKRWLWLWLIGGAAAALGVGAAWLLLTVPAADVTRAINHAFGVGYAGGGTSVTIADRVALALRDASRIAHSRSWWPAMGLSVLVAIPLRSVRVRAVLATVLPLAVAIPGYLALTRGTPWTFGVPVLSYLLAFTLSLVPLALVTGVRRDARRPDLRVFLLLTGVFSACAVPLVLVTTSAGFVGGMSGLGATPFALAAGICWLVLIGEWAGSRAVFAAVAVLLAVQLALLFSMAYKDGAPLALKTRVAHGAVAGILTTPERAADIAGVERALGKVIKPGSRLLVVNAPLVYALTDARPFTYSTWVNPGPSDVGVVDYYQRVGMTPDIVVVSRGFMSAANDSVPADPGDPLLSWVAGRYEVVDRVGYVILRRR